MDGQAPRGQVLAIVAVLMAVLLGVAGVAIDFGRQAAEQRHVQNAADAGALAACRVLIDGGTDADAALAAREVALANLQGSPAAASPVIDATPTYVDQDGSGSIDADELVSGIVVAGTGVRVAIRSDVPTSLARIVGIASLDAGARARCELQGGPQLPLVVNRYAAGSFADHVATAGTSGSGGIDPFDPRGYDGRVPASEVAPGPSFGIFGPGSASISEPAFLGFAALDVRNFESATSRVYVNGVTSTTDSATLRDIHGEYLVNGYPGPAFPTVSNPSNGDTQVAALAGTDILFVTDRVARNYQAGDRVLLAVYDGIVLQIPDFTILPPAEIALPSTTTAPVNGPSFVVRRAGDFASSVGLTLIGDAGATALGMPELNLLPDPPVSPLDPGQISAPAFTPNGFAPAAAGTSVQMTGFESVDVPPGIYAAWIVGDPADPTYQPRRVPVSIRVQTDADGDGDYDDPGDIPTTRDFSLAGSILAGSTPTLGGTIDLPITVSTGTGSAAWDDGTSTASAVTLGWDAGSLTSCAYDPQAIGFASIAFASPSVTPAPEGTSTTLSITTSGLAAGCYLFTVRAHGTNSDGQPVTHLASVRFSVADAIDSGQYVDIIGFAVFEIDSVDPTGVTGHAVSGISADPQDPALRRAQRARLQPWS